LPGFHPSPPAHLLLSMSASGLLDMPAVLPISALTGYRRGYPWWLLSTHLGHHHPWQPWP